jgi:BASS family bile acid:Na+ symporter
MLYLRGMKKISSFIKNWALPFAMLAGALAYFGFVALPLSADVHALAADVLSVVQPGLIFAMLFLTFCKVSLHDLHPRLWHLWLLLIQTGSYALLALGAIAVPDGWMRVLFEGAMVCMICPTATASAVIVGKLGGNVSSLITYIIVSNFVISVWAPVWLPIVNPDEGLTFSVSFFMIVGKVFPILICPMAASWLIRHFLPKLFNVFVRHANWAFDLWCVSLALAITVTVKSIVHSHVSIWTMVGLAAISLICCLIQFRAGKALGARQGDRIAAGQALGQKNTVFAIWMAYTFLTPVVSIVGGFYSVWHNVINSYQLYKARKAGVNQ